MLTPGASHSETDHSMFIKNLVSQTSKRVKNEKQQEVKSEWLEIKKNLLSIYSKEDWFRRKNHLVLF